MNSQKYFDHNYSCVVPPGDIIMCVHITLSITFREQLRNDSPGGIERNHSRIGYEFISRIGYESPNYTAVLLITRGALDPLIYINAEYPESTTTGDDVPIFIVYVLKF